MSTKHNTPHFRRIKNKPNISALFRSFPDDGTTLLREAWADLRREEATAESWQLEGLARRRMALLAGYDEREIPDLIDRLNTETESIFSEEIINA